MPSLSESASSGDRLQTLRNLRDLLAAQIETCDSLRDLSSLSGRLQSVLSEIAELTPKEEQGDGIDEIAQRRSARRASAAKSPTRSKRSG